MKKENSKKDNRECRSLKSKKEEYAKCNSIDLNIYNNKTNNNNK